MKLPPFSLYIHFPFCKKKCPYCHFFVLKEKKDEARALFSTYLKELQLYASQLEDKQLLSIYLGGGTPSLAPANLWGELLREIPSYFAALGPKLEVTLEVNPEDISYSKALEWRQAGINRFSVGVQSFDSSLLNLLGRQASCEKIKEGIYLLQEAGCENLSIDLMYELPTLTVDKWEKTLAEAMKLPITHLSLYNLTFEPHTPFKRKEASLRSLLPTEKENLAMYKLMETKLATGGFFPYEISAFAKKGYPSLHNTGYWKGRPFLGLGPSAFSFMSQQRFQNVCHYPEYLKQVQEGKKPVGYQEQLSQEKRRRELFLVALRMREGVQLPRFEANWGFLDSSFKKALSFFQHKGLLKFSSNTFSLSEKGVFLYDSLSSELI